MIELQKIPAAPVDKREMCGHNDLFCVHAAVRGDGRRAVECRDERVLINAQPLGHGIEKLQRVKLRHVRVDHGVRDRQRQLRVCGIFGVKAERVQQLGLFPQMILPGQRVHDRRARLECAVDVLRQRTKLCQRVQICAQILLRALHAVSFGDVAVERVVLRRQHGGRALRDALADLPGFEQYIVDALRSQLCRAQHARHAAADHAHLGVYILLQRLARRRRCAVGPKKVHKLRLLLHFPLGFRICRFGRGMCAQTQKCRRRLPAAFAILIWNVTACSRRSRDR